MRFVPQFGSEAMSPVISVVWRTPRPLEKDSRGVDMLAWSAPASEPSTIAVLLKRADVLRPHGLVGVYKNLQGFIERQ